MAGRGRLGQCAASKNHLVVGVSVEGNNSGHGMQYAGLPAAQTADRLQDSPHFEPGTVSTTCDSLQQQIASARRSPTDTEEPVAACVADRGRVRTSGTDRSGMPRFPKPAEGSWTQHYPQLGTEPVSYEDSISPEIHELEREAIFKRAWLNVGRIEQLPRKGSYFTKGLKAVNTSIILVRTAAGTVKAYHNVCRHRGNKLVWNDMPLEETSGVCRQFTCKYHAWRYDLDGNLTFVQQEEEFFDLDKSRYGLVSVHCDVWEGFIFINFAKK